VTQTAVEWLITEVKKFNTIITREYMLMLLEQAKEMEKEQIIQAFEQGENNSVDYFNPENKIKESEQYYNETFKK
jgi:hypothetical protein